VQVLMHAIDEGCGRIWLVRNREGDSDPTQHAEEEQATQPNVIRRRRSAAQPNTRRRRATQPITTSQTSVIQPNMTRRTGTHPDRQAAAHRLRTPSPPWDWSTNHRDLSFGESRRQHKINNGSPILFIVKSKSYKGRG
jgi:hypothetical protein